MALPAVIEKSKSVISPIVLVKACSEYTEAPASVEPVALASDAGESESAAPTPIQRGRTWRGKQPDPERAERILAVLRQARASKSAGEKRALLDTVIVEHMRIAHSIAARYRGKGVDRDDLDQVAYMGLVKAAESCDPARCDDFLHYAVPTINGELKRYFRDHAWTVRPPRRLQELQPVIAATRRDLLQSLGREPTNEELATSLEITEADVREAVVAGRGFTGVCLDPMVDNGFGGSQSDPELAKVEDHLMLAGLFVNLTDREREILALRYFKGWTQAEIGRELGVSQMHISRILRRAIKKLQPADTELQQTA